MGANQSSGSRGGNHPAGNIVRDSSPKKCYYELLDVHREASEDEIKKAYRKKALELHPDRNYGNVEEATTLFAAVQTAYEILSDPQERAWYDTHRDAILRNEEDAYGEHYDHDVRITIADDILQMFARFHGRIDYSDSATGFYGVLRESFATIAREEELACKWEGTAPVAYPSFGHANDSFEDVVKPFYAIWNGFATKKTFAWEDIYHCSEAPDRRVRRLMEKENKRCREEGIAKFNSAVRSLLAFVKKRDIRFKLNLQTEAERQQTLRDAAVAQAARSRAANQAKTVKPEVIPEWMKSAGAEEDMESEEVEETFKQEVKCVVCSKSFKSEKQYEAHEKSKKHTKAVQHLRRQMQQEAYMFDLAGADEAPRKSPLIHSLGDATSDAELPDPGVESPGEEKDSQDSDEVSHHSLAPEAPYSQNDTASVDRSPTPASLSGDDIYAPRKKIDDHLLSETKITIDGNNVQADTDEIAERLASESLDLRPRPGKAKEKRAKKAAQKSSAAAQSKLEFSCVTCQANFPSKTRLFVHIKDSRHAQPISKPTKSDKGKKR